MIRSTPPRLRRGWVPKQRLVRLKYCFSKFFVPYLILSINYYPHVDKEMVNMYKYTNKQSKTAWKKEGRGMLTVSVSELLIMGGALTASLVGTVILAAEIKATRMRMFVWGILSLALGVGV